MEINFETFKNIVVYWHGAGVTAMSKCGHPECATQILVEALSKEFPEASERLIHGLVAMTMAFTLLGMTDPENRAEVRTIIFKSDENERKGYL